MQILVLQGNSWSHHNCMLAKTMDHLGSLLNDLIADTKLVDVIRQRYR